MREMTKENLKASFAGESQAHTKYLIFADKAEKEGYKNIARLFKAVAYAERVHAENHLKLFAGEGTTLTNLDMAIEGENFEVAEMYEAYKSVADLQGEKAASRSFHYALEAEKIHSVLFKQAQELVKLGKDWELENIFVCPVCGYTVVDTIPEKCPVCGTIGEKFKKF